MSQKKVDAPRQAFYKGLTFGLQTTGRYYQSYDKRLPERLLHRYVWYDHHGEIPEGYVIHHKDGDWTNSDISNLELMGRSEHLRMHVRENLKKPCYKEKILKGLEKAQKAAAKWHGSEEGRKWHSKHSKEGWAKEGNREHHSVCQVCGGPAYTPKRTTPRKYCSEECAKKAWDARFPTLVVTAECKECGQAFEKQRYSKSRFCCKKCKGLAAWRTRRNVQPDS